MGVLVDFVKASCESAFSVNAELLSLVCDRDATTIDPLVNGQQLIAPEGAGPEGKEAVSASTGVGVRSCVIERRLDLCRALQQAWLPIPEAEAEISATAAIGADSAVVVRA